MLTSEFTNTDCSLFYGQLGFRLALHSKSLAPRTSFSEGKVRVYPQHSFGLATAGCPEQQSVFFSFGCVFFSLLCGKRKENAHT